MNHIYYSNNDVFYIIKNNFESHINLYVSKFILESNNQSSKVFMYVDKVFLDKVTYNKVTVIGDNKEFRGSIDIDVFIEVADGSIGYSYNKYKLISKISLEFIFYSTSFNISNVYYMNNEIYSNFNVISSYVINTTRF